MSDNACFRQTEIQLSCKRQTDSELYGQPSTFVQREPSSSLVLDPFGRISVLERLEIVNGCGSLIRQFAIDKRNVEL